MAHKSLVVERPARIERRSQLFESMRDTFASAQRKGVHALDEKVVTSLKVPVGAMPAPPLYTAHGDSKVILAEISTKRTGQSR